MDIEERQPYYCHRASVSLRSNFLRTVRMQRALHIMEHQPDITFAQLAYECAFTDQSHMIKEFKLFSGYSPKEYLKVCAPVSDMFE